MNLSIKSHTMFSESDYFYFQSKGYSDTEILNFWDRDAKRGETPTSHNPGMTQISAYTLLLRQKAHFEGIQNSKLALDELKRIHAELKNLVARFPSLKEN